MRINRIKRTGKVVQPDVLLTEEVQVAVVDVESKVVGVAVEGDDFALRVGRHPLEEDAFAVLESFGAVFLRLTVELHLKNMPIRLWPELRYYRTFFKATSFIQVGVSSTDQNGEDSSVSDEEGFHLEGLAESSCLVHSSHGRCLVCVDVLAELLSVQGKTRVSPLNLFSLQISPIQPAANETSAAADAYFPTAFSSTS